MNEKSPPHLDYPDTPNTLIGLRVLLVEDNPDDAVLLEELLTQTDGDPVELVRAECLDQALRRLRQEHFDVVLLDLGLPDSQGLDTFTRVHQGEPRVPIIVLTGLEDRQLSTQAVGRERRIT